MRNVVPRQREAPMCERALSQGFAVKDPLCFPGFARARKSHARTRGASSPLVGAREQHVLPTEYVVEQRQDRLQHVRNVGTVRRCYWRVLRSRTARPCKFAIKGCSAKGCAARTALWGLADARWFHSEAYTYTMIERWQYGYTVQLRFAAFRQ